MDMVSRPKIPTNVQNELLTHLVSTLEGVAGHQLAFKRLSRKRKRGNPPNGEEKEDATSTPSGASLIASVSTVVSQIYKTQTCELNLLSTTWWWVLMQ